jgi:hypothetical protein
VEDTKRFEKNFRGLVGITPQHLAEFMNSSRKDAIFPNWTVEEQLKFLSERYYWGIPASYEYLARDEFYTAIKMIRRDVFGLGTPDATSPFHVGKDFEILDPTEHPVLPFGSLMEEYLGWAEDTFINDLTEALESLQKAGKKQTRDRTQEKEQEQDKDQEREKEEEEEMDQDQALGDQVVLNQPTSNQSSSSSSSLPTTMTSLSGRPVLPIDSDSEESDEEEEPVRAQEIPIQPPVQEPEKPIQAPVLAQPPIQMAPSTIPYGSHATPTPLGWRSHKLMPPSPYCFQRLPDGTVGRFDLPYPYNTYSRLVLRDGRIAYIEPKHLKNV